MQSPYGGAINGQEEGGFTKIRSCRFFNNSASDKGGAIHIETRSHLLDVRDTEFDSNVVSVAVDGHASCTEGVAGSPLAGHQHQQLK